MQSVYVVINTYIVKNAHVHYIKPVHITYEPVFNIFFKIFIYYSSLYSMFQILQIHLSVIGFKYNTLKPLITYVHKKKKKKCNSIVIFDGCRL